MKRVLTGLIVALVAIAFFSCRENSLEKQRQNELKKLDEFIRAHYAEVERRPSGLYYIPLQAGTGDSIKIGDQVQIYYSLKDLDDRVIVETTGYSGGFRFDPISLVVQHPNNLGSSAQAVNEIRALHEALTYMKKGSRSKMIFDSALGFGQFGSLGIGGFTSLIMEVEVYKVFPAQTPEE